MELTTASRKKVKLRLGLSSVSGGGKTMSALLLAYGFCKDWSKIAVIDSEHDSASLYSHLGAFKTISLDAPYSPERYIEAIKLCEKSNMEVVVVDSMTHEWDGEGGILEMADKLGGGFQGAWKALTPRHVKFTQAILNSTCHTITTTRRKQEYSIQDTVNGKGRIVQSPVKLGLKEITREGWEFELTVNLVIDINHLATASKDRTGLFTDKDPFIITEQTGVALKEWCETGFDMQELINKAVEEFKLAKSLEDLISIKDKYQLVVKDEAVKLAGNEAYVRINPKNTVVKHKIEEVGSQSYKVALGWMILDPAVNTLAKLQAEYDINPVCLAQLAIDAKLAIGGEKPSESKERTNKTT